MAFLCVGKASKNRRMMANLKALCTKAYMEPFFGVIIVFSYVDQSP